jgi:hypothetical protein
MRRRKIVRTQNMIVPKRTTELVSGTEDVAGLKVTPVNPFSLNPKKSEVVKSCSSLSPLPQENAPNVAEAPLPLRHRTSAGSVLAVVAKNSNEVIMPAVIVKLSATWSAQFVAMSPPARAGNPAGIEVRTSELAAPEPELNGRSNVPLIVPRTVPDVALNEKLKSESAEAVANPNVSAKNIEVLILCRMNNGLLQTRLAREGPLS